ncbi:MAG: iron-containing alcohol dehydrogenase [Anaerolineae bacterium]|nr:iron-containing alcohol dehydrogenase [Anaerolineae bacterium]
MRFEFATANRIIFGPGTVKEAGQIALSLGQRALVVTGRSVQRAQPLLEDLQVNGLETHIFSVEKEPDIALVQKGAAIARKAKCDIVIGFGGGSALDTGKAIAALLTNPGEVLDYLEVIGKGKPLTRSPVPIMAIPTTSGTGTEVTRNAVLASPEHHVKVSLRSSQIIPDVAIVDPALTLTVPPSVTASTGLDALTQVLEPYVSHKANPLTDTICREGIRRAAGSLRQAYEHGDDLAAREDMSLASLFGGLALANAKLGAVHGFAGPMGGMFPAPHGALCGKLLPYVIEINIRALRERDPQNIALQRYDEIATLLTKNLQAKAEDGANWIKELCDHLQVPGLASYGIQENDFPAILERVSRSSSMKGNPIQLTEDELREILQRSL